MVTPLTPSGMDNRRLDQLIRELGCKIDGAQGQWRFEAFEITMFCVTDELHDRMRVIAPILPVADLENGMLEECMEANFDRALDARYCTSEGTIWGAFIHPLRSLSDGLFRSAVRQVAELTRNFGGSFSSGQLEFRGLDDTPE